MKNEQNTGLYELSVNNITLGQFYNLDNADEYISVIQYSKTHQQPVDVYKVGSFEDMNFGLIKDLQSDISNELTFEAYLDYVCKIANKTRRCLQRETLLNLYQFRAYILESIETISKIEERSLAGEADSYSQQAGIEKLSMFGVQLQIRDLANNDVTKFESVRNSKYKICFVELVIRKELSEYEKRYAKLFKKK